MYDASDPRASLSPGKPTKAPAAPAFPATYARFYEEGPQRSEGRERTWIVRGQTFVLLHTEAVGEHVFFCKNQPDEYALLIPDEATTAIVEAGGNTQTVGGYSLTFIPPGESSISLPTGGRIIRLFTNAATDLLEKASNAALYAVPNPAIPAFVPWPEPRDGYRIRTYSLDVAPEPGRFGRIFRGSTFMVNFLEPKNGPRDPSLLSPHDHDDFEQCSLALSGEYIHHLRWPWTTDKVNWRNDEHQTCASPSVAVIPPGVIHTSEAVGPSINQLVDIFCPPRADFSAKRGWVLNEDDYPLPVHP